MSKTAWGEVEMQFAETTVDEAMPTVLASIGEILEGSLGLEKEDGTKLQLFKEGHILVDELQQEPTLKVKATIIGIPNAIKEKFWDTENTGSGDSEKYAVKSLINSKKFAIAFAAVKVPGSETFEAMKCTISMSPLYSSTQGWTSDVQITIIKGLTGKLFQFGKVPATGGFAPMSSPVSKSGK